MSHFILQLSVKKNYHSLHCDIVTKENRDSQVQSLGWEDPPEEKMATHSSILAGRSHG